MKIDKLLTLCLVRDEKQVLLGMKQRGIGEGRWNGFGGKVERGEMIEEAAKRELHEESCLESLALKKCGIIDFVWKETGERWQVHVFNVLKFIGEPVETEEMHPQWFAFADIPFEAMWPDDRYWFPLFLAGKKFRGTFHFDQQERILEHQLDEVENLE